MRKLMLVVALIFAPLTFAQEEEQEPLQFRVSVDLVTMTVSARDAMTNEIVTNLTRSDFQVYEDGHTQDIAYFERGSIPLRIVLMMDVSSSMDARIMEVRDSAWEIIRSLRPEDKAKVVHFDEIGVSLQDEFTSDKQSLMIAADSFNDGDGTALYTALYVQIRELSEIDRRDRSLDKMYRSAIVLLTDGIDTSSRLHTDDDVFELTRNSDIVIYTVLMPPLPLTDSKSGQRQKSEAELGAEYFMRHVAEDTGGRIYIPRNPDELGGAFRHVAQEIAMQYRIGYASPDGPNGYRHISVLTPGRENTLLRHRKTYRVNKPRR